MASHEWHAPGSMQFKTAVKVRLEARVRPVRRFIAGTLVGLTAIAGCGGGGDDSTQPGPGSPRWTSLGPERGFVSSVAFDPSVPGRLWASGDDSSGIFLSTDDGMTWVRQTTVPRDHATYSLVIDPLDSSRIYAPNYFGRGLLTTGDNGMTWSVRGTGLPMFGPGSKLSDLAIDPSSTAVLFACTASGLFRSVDFGENFSQVTSPTFGADVDFRSIASSSDGVFVGSATGRVYRSTDAGTNWTEVTTAAFVAVTDLAVTDNALYVAFLDGSIINTTTFTSAGLSILNTGGGSGAIDTGLWTKLAAISGASAATDTLYVGTVAKPMSTLWGFHASFDGGATFERRVNGLEDASVFSIAVDPMDAAEVVIGTVGMGIYRTVNGGQQWNQANSGVHATAALGVAVDPSNSDHVLVSSTEGFDGTDGLFETMNGGATWSVVTSLATDALSLDIHPTDPSIFLAGSFNEDSGPRPGIMRSQNGSAGPWTATLVTSVQVERFVRAHGEVFAIATQSFAPAGPADLGTYASADDGATWTLRYNTLTTNLAPHPSANDELIVVGGGRLGVDGRARDDADQLGALSERSR